MIGLALHALPPPTAGAAVNVAPFGRALPGEIGIFWEDPREVHRVVVRFAGPPPTPGAVRLEYWGSRWPQQRLPKDREPGGGDVGWWELGNWHNGGWRAADTECVAEDKALVFTFRPVNAREHPELADYPAAFRYTLKLRLLGIAEPKAVQGLEVYTDSVWERRTARLVWERPLPAEPKISLFNGAEATVTAGDDKTHHLSFWAARNPDPNTFDRTLVTVHAGRTRFTFRPDDLREGPLILRRGGVAVLAEDDPRTFAQVEAARAASGARTLRQRVAEMPERTWHAAWRDMPAKRSAIDYPLSLDGARQRFRLAADGSFTFRTNDHYLRERPGADTPLLALEPGPVRLDFGLPSSHNSRRLLHPLAPFIETEWLVDGVRVRQNAGVLPLEGLPSGTPPPDRPVVLAVAFSFDNQSGAPRSPAWRMRLTAGRGAADLACQDGLILAGGRPRAVVKGYTALNAEQGALVMREPLAPRERRDLLLFVPYTPLTQPQQMDGLRALDFEDAVQAAGPWWEKRLAGTMRLLTPEPALTEFHQTHAQHLLANCELQPDAPLRFARVGSFHYGAYGNESCMMVVDLDRRGLHREAEECLNAWLRYQGTVPLPGDFSDHEGVLYGAGGYEAGGYNQHHGWILWCLAEHYRFTRDRGWLERSANWILRGAEWIVRQRARTLGRDDLGRGLLPAGSLEDIGDWWPWLSTNCYTWRGLDAAAWALAQIGHPEAPRLRREADAYKRSLLTAFTEASILAPVVRLRDGTAVRKFPSHVYRRGRSFGWICETLEGALHLLIAGVLDPRSPEARDILDDYEDNLYLSNQYGYTVPDFEKQWYALGGMSMQACLLLHVEPYLSRDEVKSALRGLFNAIAVGLFPDVRMLTEHALPELGDWRGDHFKSSDESNAAGWLRYLFVREEGERLLIGQAVPLDWLASGRKCGVERAATHFGPVDVAYHCEGDRLEVRVEGANRNSPATIRVRRHHPSGKRPRQVMVNGRPWRRMQADWAILPGTVRRAEITALF